MADITKQLDRLVASFDKLNRINEAVMQQVQAVVQEYDQQIEANNKEIHQEKLSFNLLQTTDIPNTRTSVSLQNMTSNLVLQCESAVNSSDGDRDQMDEDIAANTRTKVTQLDQYTLELMEELSCLKAQNDIYEHE